MSTSIKTQTYTALVRDIIELYNRARHALVEAYWQIGRRIVEQEQQGVGKAEYGVQLLEHLSEDLQQKLGHGFSERNLYKMRQFYLTQKISPPAAKLSWSQHVELLPITNKADKERLVRRIISNKSNTLDTWQMSSICLRLLRRTRPGFYAFHFGLNTHSILYYSRSNIRDFAAGCEIDPGSTSTSASVPMRFCR